MARYLLFLIALLCGCTTECSQSSNKACDFKLEETLVLSGPVQPWDLDHDGSDEFVGRLTSGNEAGRSIHILSSNGFVIEQVNFAGTITPVHFGDYDNDQSQEIIVPYIRNDSLFVAFLSSKGEKLFQFFLVNGYPRIGDDGAIEREWDPAIRLVYLADVNGDTNNELITVVYTGYARNPRGILVNSLPDGELIGKYMIGSFPSQSFFGDFDSNGHPEVVLSTWAPDNGASVNGFDDRHSYIINVELTPEPVLKWSREMGGIGSNVFLMHANFDADPDAEFLSLSYMSAARKGDTSLELIDPTNWKTLQRKPINAVLREPQVIHPYMDKKGHIVAIRDPGEIWRYDDNFEIDRSNAIASNYHALTSLPDMDGDGVEEIVVVLPDATIYLLDGGLEAKATYKGLTAIHQASTTVAQRVSRGIGEDPALLLYDGSSSHLLSLSENKAAWLYRNRLLWLVFFTALLLFILYRHRKETTSERIANSFINYNGSATAHSKHSGFMGRAKLVIDNQLSDPDLTIKKIAELLGVTTQTLRRRFADTVGETPKQYLLRIRINKGKLLLRTTHMQIGEVAAEVGFRNSNQFSKHFKRRTKMTPSAYRSKYMLSKDVS